MCLYLIARLHMTIKDFCRKGDRLAKQGFWKLARDEYWKAFDLIPEPREDRESTVSVLCAIGDSFFVQGDYPRALEAFQDAVRCAGGLGNPFVHMRLGQCHYEGGDMGRSADDLARAYLLAGPTPFHQEDPKYLALVERALKIPHDRMRTAWRERLPKRTSGDQR